MRKAALIRRTIFSLFFIVLLALTGCMPAAPTSLPTQAATSTPPNTPTDTSTNTPPVDTATPTEAAPATFTFLAEADARVKEEEPGRNDGDGDILQVDGSDDPGLESFLRFTVSGVSGQVSRAVLRVYATDNGSGDGPAVYSSDPTWGEETITWDTRPAHQGDVLANTERIEENSWVEYDVTSLVTGNGTFSFVLVADSSDAVIFSSRQGVEPPQLVVSTGDHPIAAAVEPTALPTVVVPTMGPLPAGAVVFVGAGDIATCRREHDEATAQLLDSIPGTVFTTGDNVYDEGTLAEFQECYEPSWGRHKDRTRPVPGNHDYLTEGAAAYFEYFAGVESYYAYDLGQWRIYALNSEIDISATSAQIAWLQEDLATHPNQCVLAYWHRPRWSSGEHHGSNPDVQDLWQVLYEAGAELVLNGHEHNYERFAPMDAQGQVDPLGMREIIVGTGGKTLYPFKEPLPGSEVRNGDTFGVLRLVLRESGYDWQFVPVPGSSFIDGGSAECH